MEYCMRGDGRKDGELRRVRMTRNFIEHAAGSVLMEMGQTKVLCSVTYNEGVPPFLTGGGRGWLTGEYAMLPASTPTRNTRESTRGRVGGRTHEIQRLIGRSLRAVTDLSLLGEQTIHVDCDVLQADGGTRTAAITGAFIALVDSCRKMQGDGIIDAMPVRDYLAAVSVGVIDGRILLDLDYAEDSRADVDMNVVMTRGESLVEVQGTAEGKPFDRKTMDRMMDKAADGIRQLTEKQRELIGSL